MNPEIFELPAIRMSPDSVTLDITFVRVPAKQSEIDSQLWQHVDEQLLSVEERLHLNSNGFRFGLVGSQLPDVLRDLLDQQAPANGFNPLVSSDMDVLTQNRHVQTRSGQRTEVVTSSPRPEMVVLHRAAGGTKVSGKSFPEGQCVLATRSFPLGDGTARLEITPEVHHGAPRNQWVSGAGGTFHLLPGREREVFQDLMIDVVLTPGQTFLLSCTPDKKGLGQNFFVETGRGDSQQKLLLIRLAQTQRDDLFESPAKPTDAPDAP